MLLKNSLERGRLMAMVRARRSRGSDRDDGARYERAEAVVLLIRVMISAGFFEAYSELAPA